METTLFAHRPTWMTINQQLLKKNIQTIQKNIEDKKIYAVVKADAYHHGITGVFLTFIEENIYSFAVSQYDEAVFLQALADQYSVEIEILIMSDISYDVLPLIKENWRISISHVSWVEGLLSEDDIIQKVNKLFLIKAHIKVNSGMSRRGIKDCETLAKLLTLNEKRALFNFEGIYSHFSTADSDSSFMQKQYHVFYEIIKDFLPAFAIIHIENSSAIGQVIDTYGVLNACRPGAALYGLGTHKSLTFEPIAALYSQVQEVNPINAGEYVGYGNTFVAPTSGYIGILPVGYADGMRRAMQNFVVQGEASKYQIVGRICMEQTLIFSIHPMKEGEKIEFFGPNLSIKVLESFLNTIDYEILCLISERIPKKYI